MAKGKDIWIEKGYEVFALHGASGLKVEALSKSLDISKSSFYHHFADIKSLFDNPLQKG
jgi:AcrR family transcriptional regulator